LAHYGQTPFPREEYRQEGAVYFGIRYLLGVKGMSPNSGKQVLAVLTELTTGLLSTLPS
jgi:hypothetical protein